MPRVTKDTPNNAIEKKKTNKKKSLTVSKKAVSKSTTTKTNSKTGNAKSNKSLSKEKNRNTKSSSKAKESTVTSKTKATKKKNTTNIKKLEGNIFAEYYDLPYRYNETIVKILYQTPTILFVYWDISDSDKEKFIQEYGENFFNNTTPILKVFNLTKNYSFEVEINDYANSWYINVNDANCDYKVELARRSFNSKNNYSDYIYISSSNHINFPNDHILLEKISDVIRFKNVKTNTISTKNIGTLHLIGINKIYNAYNFYKKFYKDEILEEINNKKIMNPSSSSWS